MQSFFVENLQLGGIEMKHIISLSGGIGSYIVLKRILEIEDSKDVMPIFIDVCWEDEDLYRFLLDIERGLGIKIKKIKDGRTPKQLAVEENFLYNSRIANCSKKLKSKVFKEYIKSIDEEIIIHFGIDFTEAHRCEAIRKNYKKYAVEFYLCDPPYIYKNEMLKELREDGIKIPLLYELGFSHNNCGGRCFKAGIGHYKLLYEKLPKNFLEIEEFENEMQERIGKKVAILRRHGRPFPLSELRKIMENQPKQLTIAECRDIGGCGCFVEIER